MIGADALAIAGLVVGIAALVVAVGAFVVPFLLELSRRPSVDIAEAAWLPHPQEPYTFAVVRVKQRPPKGIWGRFVIPEAVEDLHVTVDLQLPGGKGPARADAARPPEPRPALAGDRDELWAVAVLFWDEDPAEREAYAFNVRSHDQIEPSIAPDEDRGGGVAGAPAPDDDRASPWKKPDLLLERGEYVVRVCAQARNCRAERKFKLDARDRDWDAFKISKS